MKRLVLDRGNTSLKYAVYDGVNQIDVARVDQAALHDIQRVVDEHHIEAVAWCTSGLWTMDPRELSGPSIKMEMNSDVDFPLNVDYLTPDTLGPDRMANVLGAWSICADQDMVVFSLGTCMTVDFIRRDGTWLGGVISPGLEMRYRSMHSFTAALPMTHQRHVQQPIGRSTIEALASGGYHGIRLEIEGWMTHGGDILGTPHVYMSGGGSEELAYLMKRQIFVEPYLTLKGLNHLLTIYG